MSTGTPPPPGPAATTDVVLIRDGRVIGIPTAPGFTDQGVSPWRLHVYRLTARNDAAETSGAVHAGARRPQLQHERIAPMRRADPLAHQRTIKVQVAYNRSGRSQRGARGVFEALGS